jgi:antitoxin component YwqK of YwqJK toxin-antitoxin module
MLDFDGVKSWGSFIKCFCFIGINLFSNLLFTQVYSDTLKIKDIIKISNYNNESLSIVFYDNEGRIDKEEYYYQNELKHHKTWYYNDSSYGYILSIKNIKVDTIREFYLNGNLKLESVLVDNKLHGANKTFYPNGQIMCNCYFKMNKRDSINTVFYENGKIETVCNYINGKIDGIMKFYYENGNLWSERIYNNGRLINIVYNKDINGNSLKVGAFVNGNGTVYVYDKNGKMIEIEYYKKGKLKRTKVSKQ